MKKIEDEEYGDAGFEELKQDVNITSRVAFILYQSLFMVGDLGKCNSGIRYTDKSDGTTKANFFIIDSFCVYDIWDDLIKLGGPWPNLEDYLPKEAEGYIVLHNENIFAKRYLDIVKNGPENMSDKEAEQRIIIEGIKKILPHSIEKHDLALRYLLDEQ